MQEKVKKLVETYDLTASPESRYMDLVMQVGELGKAILNSTDYGYRKFSVTSDIKEEAGSCLFSFLALLNDYGLDENELLDQVIGGYEEKIRSFSEPE